MRSLLLCLCSALALPAQAQALFFDDFSHADAKALSSAGWTIRTQTGWPGVAGARWWHEGVQLVADPAGGGNRLLRLRAASDGTPAGTRQTQLCHARKYLEGTYAARVRFSDAPVTGPDGDAIVQTFYLISPLKAPKHPDYSEADFEYLPNGGWGASGPALYATTWETFIPAPNFWKDNQYDRLAGTQQGWHTLVLQIAKGKVDYFLDGKPYARHGGDYYPEVPMSINFNLWFSELTASGKGAREYHEDVDWVLHVKDAILSPAEVSAQVAALRAKGVGREDSVPGRNLPSPCDL
ncbi:glycoside hydrolase family 16 protein [Chitiniphilus purpureus]|uniref:Glycoside hydrolase family 16 protein n=1 Tax=Chitiniphilus purpureus TaxID=2981137 RepID=A0ABY6DKQ9_9NEIS|nr:glycoside hydrolase family 16 protein [Chitiniphilus sp. CD1]UXY14950.1 glycoside hydrolase family 16 protein [Chitiniphilus sp. CD1]